mgnify:CR=1 FL=1
MALASNYPRSILLDSSFRDRAKYPYQGDFVVIPEEGKKLNGISDPVGVGYPLHTGLVSSYTAGPPTYLELKSAITATFPENVLLGRDIEILVGSTAVSRGSSKIIGFGAVAPIVRLYLESTIPNTAADDTVIVRQLDQPKPNQRHVLTVGSTAGDTTLTLIGGSSKTNYYVGMYFGVLGASQTYKISAYNSGTQVITFAPPLSANLSIGDILEIYSVEDNNSGLSKSGHITGGMFSYEVRLDWLNIPVASLWKNESSAAPQSIAKKITEFSYILVEFRNDAGSTDTIQSNNRKSKAATFIVPIDDRAAGTGNFLTLRGSTPIVLMLNMDGPIRLTLRLPTGDVIRYDSTLELSSLKVPNPDLQIAAHFTIRRMI